jgi:hypothetical protein
MPTREVIEMTLPATVEIPAEVMVRQVGDETVILDLASGNYYGLDPVGARIWQLLTEGRSLADVRDIMLAEYEVAHEELEHDLDRLLRELLAQGLVRTG